METSISLTDEFGRHERNPDDAAKVPCPTSPCDDDSELADRDRALLEQFTDCLKQVDMNVVYSYYIESGETCEAAKICFITHHGAPRPNFALGPVPILWREATTEERREFSVPAARHGHVC